eukprot:3655459-Prymnesium_polylepis.1
MADVRITASHRLCASPEAQNHLVPMSRLRPADLRFLSGFGRSCLEVERNARRRRTAAFPRFFC